MVLGFSDVSMTPKTNSMYLWQHQDSPANPRKNTILLKHIILFLESSKFWKLGTFIYKRRGSDNPEDPSNYFGNLEYGIDIYPQNMKWRLGNMGAISCKKY